MVTQNELMLSLLWDLKDEKSQCNWSPGTWTSTMKIQDAVEVTFPRHVPENWKGQCATRKETKVDSRNSTDGKDQMSGLSACMSFI